ncbi:MAG: hypothetical protein ACLRZ9_07920 [Eubacterium sp.]
MQYFMFLTGIILAFAGLLIFKKNRKRQNKYIFAIVISLFIAMSLEVCTFNYAAFEIIGKNCQKKSYNIDIARGLSQNEESSTDNRITTAVSEDEDKNTYTITVSEIDTIVNNIDIIPETNDDIVEYDLYYTDDAKSELTKTDCDPQVIVKDVTLTQHIKPHFAGKTYSIQLNLNVDHDKYISALSIYLNYKKDFHFNLVRFIFVLLFTLLMLTVSLTWNKAFEKSLKRKFQKWVFIGFAAFEILFISLLAYTRDNQEGILQDKDSIYSMDVYQELTVALAQGKVDLNGLYPEKNEAEQQGIDALKKLDNPYEWGQRDNIVYKWDRAFYNGKYYCYFGIVPALVFYLPCYLVTGKLLNTMNLVWLLVMLCVVLMSLLVYNIAKRWKSTLNLWVVVGAMAGFVNCSMLFFCIEGSKFYEIATVSALACVLAGINLIYTAVSKRNINKICLTAGALFMALAVGCRPNFLLATLIVLPIVLNGLSNGNHVVGTDKGSLKAKAGSYIRNIFRKENCSAIILFAVPFILVGSGLMFYNYIRFDSIFEFGAKYQLTVYDTSYYKATDFGKLPVALYKCILALPVFSNHFPFVGAVSTHSEYMGYFYQMACMGIMSYPVMWLILMLPWSLKRGIREQGERGLVIASLMAGLTGCYITTALGGASLRYSVDFAWMLCIPIIYIIFDLYSRACKKKITKYIFILLGVMIFATVMINMLTCFSPSWSDISEKQPELFYSLEKMIIFWR